MNHMTLDQAYTHAESRTVHPLMGLPEEWLFDGLCLLALTNVDPDTCTFPGGETEAQRDAADLASHTEVQS